MFRRLTCAVLGTALITGILVIPPAVAQPRAKGADLGRHIRAGYGEADATWHVGASSGQYAGKKVDEPPLPEDFDYNPEDTIGSVEDDVEEETSEVDPHGHATTQRKSYGVQSRLTYRTIVVEDADGDEVALVKSDNYLAQDALSRRAAQILAEKPGNEIDYVEIFHMATHNHFSPYYTTPSWGVWLFQDLFDIRAFEYHARQMAESIWLAQQDLRPAKMGAATIEHHLYKGMVARRTTTDDGTPGGYPLDFGDFGLSILRFDTLDSEPIATLINWGMHPEGLEGDGLITAEFLGPLERIVERATRGGVVFGQGDVGSAESGPARPYEFPKGYFRQWDNAGHAQVERGAYLLAQDVMKAWNSIATATAFTESGPGDANDPDGLYDPVWERVLPFDSDFDVEAGDAWIPGPVSHPYPSVSNCRTATTAGGAPGSPILGVPDCERGGQASRSDLIWENMKAHGIPVPDHYDAPAFTGVEENLRLHLQAFKLGEVILMSCACEAQVDLILNLETRTDETQENEWLGYQWVKRLDCTQSGDETSDWTCVRDSNDPAAPGSLFPRESVTSYTFTNDEYLRMQAQITNNAKDWDLPENAVAANAEPGNPEEIWGNFTHEELSATEGYKLPIAFGHAGDYLGYTVSYREYMSYDHYRKALTSYGAHTADYMNTRLTRLARELNGGAPLPPEPHEAMGDADEARQVGFTTAMGQMSSNLYDAWVEALPDDAGAAEPVTDPGDIERFDSTTFTWRGGSNAIDNPVVRVERQNESGGWEFFADQSGEIQTKVQFPEGANAFSDTYSGEQEWLWTANFEAFNAFPREIGSTPEGTYHFVVEGVIRKGGENVFYSFPSNDFAVEAWDGLTASNLARSGDSVTFEVDGRYPVLDQDAAFRYVRMHERSEVGGDRELRSGEARKWCDTCSFRPWALAGGAITAQMTVVQANGTHLLVPMQCSFVNQQETLSRCTGQVPVGSDAFVAAGAITDSYGESNSDCFELDGDGGTECPPAPAPDTDDDGVIDAEDNCAEVANEDQANSDGDLLGDACDSDRDGDGVDNEDDNCADEPNPQQENRDRDETGDACDESTGDDPLADNDGDGRLNGEETTAGSDPNDPCDPSVEAGACDRDDDNVPNATDNCDEVANDQADVDEDGVGDACDPTDDRPTPGPTEEPSEEPSQEPSASSEPSGSPTTDPGNGGNGGGGSGGGGSGGGGSSPAPTQSAAGDERGTVVTSIAADKTISNHRKPVTLSGEVTGDRVCATSEVEIVARTFGATEFEPVDTVEVGADGMWSTTVRSARSTAYAAQPVGNDLCEGQLSSTVDVLVRARVIASVRNRCDGRHAINGRVAPAYPGTIVKLKAKKNGRWVTVDRARLTIKSRFHFARCKGTRIVWPKQDVRNEKGRAPVLTNVSIS